MKQDTKRTLADFTNRAMQRLQDKQVPKKQQLHIPSLDENITIRSLTRDEIVECQTMEEEPGSNRADKYCIYLAVVDPDLHAVAKEIMAKEADLPADQRQLKEALDVVDILEPYEITEVAMAIMRLSGVIGDKKVTVGKPCRICRRSAHWNMSRSVRPFSTAAFSANAIARG